MTARNRKFEILSVLNIDEARCGNAIGVQGVAVVAAAIVKFAGRRTRADRQTEEA